MNTLLISGIYKPEVGGPATYIPALAICLQAKQNQVEVVTFKNASAKPVTEPWPLTYIQRDQFLPLRFIKTVLILLNKYKKKDVIFANGLHQETAVALFLFKKYAVAKVVGDPVWERAKNRGQTNLDIVNFNLGPLKPRHKLQRIFLTWSLNRFDKITCPSRELSEIIFNWGVTKPIEFIANGIPLAESSFDEKIFDVVSVSRLVSWKNIDLLIKSCALSNASLAIVGDGPDEEKLRKIGEQSSAKITFFGQLNSHDVENVLKKSKIFALLSDYEGLSFALLSAMANGLPSIISDVRGNSDVITDRVEGIIVDTNDSDSVVWAIKELLSDSAKATQYGQAAVKKVIAEYDQDKQIKKVINLMKRGSNFG
jgi:glycosyltransferase involved in cell wall biosynthesis